MPEDSCGHKLLSLTVNRSVNEISLLDILFSKLEFVRCNLCLLVKLDKSETILFTDFHFLCGTKESWGLYTRQNKKKDALSLWNYIYSGAGKAV